MHRCLCIRELVDSIAFHLDDGDSGNGSQPRFRDLARMARTCTVFHGPAADLIWQWAVLEILLRCMPSDLWCWHGSGSDKSTSLARPIHVGDFDRVRVYAARIRRLYSGGEGPRAMLAEIVPALGMMSLSTQLFPNLRTLLYYFEDFAYIDLFLNSRINNITFRLMSQSALSFLSTLASRCPTLHTLSIPLTNGGEYVQAAITALSDFVRHSNYLKILDVPGLDQSALEYLAQSARLESLTLNATSSLSIDSFPAVHSIETFPGLRTIEIRDAGIEPATLFLQLCRRVPLESLRLFFSDSSIPTSAQTHHFFHSLSTSFVPSSLTNLSIGTECGYFETPDEDLYSIKSNALRALFCFSNLATVLILAPTRIDIDNATVRDLAHAWPHLVILDLEDTFEFPRPNVDLECLDSFARYCPHLQKLQISLDASVVPLPQPGGAALAVQDRLTSFIAGCSAIEDPSTVARFLADRFPALRYISTWREDPDEEEELREELPPGEGEAFMFHDRWKEVESLLRTGINDSS
ncbi:hypothetical protein C8R43DRAFT_1071564 [Mycena crocata]|nr:hypothetical protein C8R43DRAFT_1071564 [Mycena crocata]